ncbi:MAG: hypothetical protein IKM72_00090 [Oscillospiraceae bacterium]|nr:hypothetical protein [Oscillospiraceae bacterium]
MIDAMKYDYIYSEAVDIITAKKDDGTKFLSKDTLCVAVTEDDKLYSAFNTINMVDGKPVTGSSEKEIIKKKSGGSSKRIEAMITMNCVEMVPVLPEKEDIDAILSLDKYNAATHVVSPNNKYISLKDLGDYDPDGDNSSIEIIKVDITARRSEKEKLMSFVPDFEKETDEGGTKSETKYLFAMPGHNNNDQINGAGQPQTPDGNMQGQVPFYTMDDVVHQYRPVDGRHRGMNASQMSVNNRSQMSVQFTQNASQQIPPGMMNGQQSVMLGQYGAPNQQNMMPQGSVQGQYGGMPNQQNMMNGQYMGQGMMPNQYGMPNQQNMMNGQYMGQGMMAGQYGQNMMNGQYMQQGMMQGQYGQYMGQGMMPGQYGQNMMNGQYMQGQGMMNGQYMQQQEEMNPQYLQQNDMNDDKNNK